MSNDSVARVTSSPITENLQVPFYIPATGPTSRPRLTLKYGNTFIVLDSHGDIGASAGGPDGLFHADTRFLSRLELLLNGVQPLLLGSSLRDDNAWLVVDQTNPDIYADDRIVLQKDTVHIVRTIFLWHDTAYQRLAVHNYGDRPIELCLSVVFDSDFADLFEVRGIHRGRRGVAERRVIGADRAVLLYQGLDHKLRRTALTFDPPPNELAAGAASYRLKLAPNGANTVTFTVACDQPIELKPVPFFRGLRTARREIRNANIGVTTVESSNEIFNELMCRSMADLHMLVTNTPQGRYPYAGIPWYSTTFGRDGLITALQMLWFEPGVARGVLRRLAHFQSKVDDPLADAQPGKILHEMRSGEMAELGEVPFGLYYGSVDATPLFVLLAGLYAERTGDDATVAELWPAIEAALNWIDGPGDPDQDGFVEYLRATAEGLANQGWKDSHDAVFHADGRLAKGHIALAEVQGYVFAGKHLAARCARRIGKIAQASKLEAEAARLAERFEAAFWCPELGTYALALDGDKKQCRVRTSNAGQVLFTGIARHDHAAEVADGLLRPEFFSGWGIRTVARSEARYNPMSYHNGSIWPHDNALIALGLARYRLKREVEQVFTGLFEAAAYMDLRRLPELFCGFQRSRGRGPTLYPVACSPQAWASATPFTLLEASLGLEFDIRRGEIRLRNPRLPAFLRDVTLRNLKLGESNTDLKISRRDETVSVETLRTEGHVQVAVLFTDACTEADNGKASPPIVSV
jgi:glycogen debranching enzyme